MDVPLTFDNFFMRGNSIHQNAWPHDPFLFSNHGVIWLGYFISERIGVTRYLVVPILQAEECRSLLNRKLNPRDVLGLRSERYLVRYGTNRVLTIESIDPSIPLDQILESKW